MLRSKAVIAVLTVALIAALAGLDIVTGPDYDFSVFYFLPVGLAAWYFGRAAALAVAIVSTACEMAANHVAGRTYPNPLVAGWHAMILLTALCAIGWILVHLQELFMRERQAAAKLQQSLAEVKVLEGLLPICASCKKIRDADGTWEQIERYIERNSGAQFTHGVCPVCANKLLAEAGLSWSDMEKS